MSKHDREKMKAMRVTPGSYMVEGRELLTERLVEATERPPARTPTPASPPKRLQTAQLEEVILVLRSIEQRLALLPDILERLQRVEALLERRQPTDRRG